MESIAFYVLGGFSVIGALLVISRRQPVAAVMWLVVSILGLAGLFFLLQAEYLGLMQVFLYGDAITVIFIFIIMVLNVPEEKLPMEQISMGALIGVIFAALGLALFLRPSLLADPGTGGTVSEGFGSISALATAIFERHFLSFQALGILVVVAIIGVTVLSRKEVEE